MTPLTTIIPRPVRSDDRGRAGHTSPLAGAAAPAAPARSVPAGALAAAVLPGPDGFDRGPTRAAVAILPGRGEGREPYEWLAGRLALDGYAASVVAPPARAASVVPDAANLARAVGEVRQPGLPLVLLGSDSGALSALAMAGSPAVRPDALVLLGLPLLHVPVAGIPVADMPPRVLPDLPMLLIHGRDDQVSPLQLVRMTTRTAVRAQLTVLPGAHSVLTGPGRRSVPARVLLFLEELLDV